MAKISYSESLLLKIKSELDWKKAELNYTAKLLWKIVQNSFADDVCRKVLVILMLPFSQKISFRIPIFFLMITEPSNNEELISLNYENLAMNLG